MIILLGGALYFFGWLWSIWRGFGVGILCGLLNIFFSPISQCIFALYEKRLRKPLLLMVIGVVLSTWSAWSQIQDYLNHRQLPPGGTMVQVVLPATTHAG